MTSYLIILFISLYIGSVQAQNWLGIYVAGSTCPTSLCCCVSGQVVVTTVATNTVSFSTGLSGGALCGGQTSYVTNMTTPTGFTATLTISVFQLTFMLSQDSLSINVTTTPGSGCSGTLTKSLTATVASTNSPPNGVIHSSQSKQLLLSMIPFFGLIRSIWSI